MNTCKGGRGNKATFTGFDLDTVEGSRETLARIITCYATGEISENQGRALTYMMANYLSYWKHEADMRIEERIEAIENALEARK